MIAPFDLVLLVLALSAALDAWFNGSIFAGARARLEDRGGFFGELFGCPFCLAYHVAFVLALFLVIPYPFDLLGRVLALLLILPFPFDLHGRVLALLLIFPFDLLGRLIVVSLAATRLAWLLDGFLPARLSYARRDVSPVPPPPLRGARTAHALQETGSTPFRGTEAHAAGQAAEEGEGEARGDADERVDLPA